ncbi:hypothetical protein J437_LFUL007350 [Ladona fulva]|uniref:Signal recognition particle 9 kDa protein n=1 Tax=Ladona fulva TaxID=123851 RepID=A0A8K0KFZ8_LADFU|nr:hypothetical protein J437_LFUL007350 [Ladona fulva]
MFSRMTYIKSWEEFEKEAEMLYLKDPMKIRYTMKYNHSQRYLSLKMTDDVVCLQYKTDIMQDMKRIEKFINVLMRHMASREQ